MKAKALTIAGLCTLAVALSFPASGVAATPPTVQHFHFTIGPSASTDCGIDTIETITASGVLTIVGSGVEVNAYSIEYDDTNPATGKTVIERAAQLQKDTFSSPTDNGDGTISIFLKSAGMDQLRIPNGPPLSIQSAGEETGILTLNATTFEFVSFEPLSSGGLQSSTAYCNVVVSALT
jgi:hypothetical protein